MNADVFLVLGSCGLFALIVVYLLVQVDKYVIRLIYGK